MKLIKYNDNWADEMDLEGSQILTDPEFAEWETKWLKRFEDEGKITFYVGTNEEIPYGSFDDFCQAFTVEDITEEEAAVLTKYFGKNMGFFPG